MHNPKISIITINLNNREGLIKTVESVLSQDYPNLEYLIIDGDSKDGSQDYVREHLDQVDFFLTERDKGVYDAMNKGIKQASGKYLIFLNSGDRFDGPKALNKLVENSNGEALVFGNILVASESNSYVKKYPEELSFKYFYYETIPHPATLISKKLFDQIGLYDTQLKIVSDWKFFMQAVVKMGCSYKYVDELISIFDTKGMSSSPSNSDLLEFERRSTLKKEFKVNYFLYSLYLKFRQKSIYKQI